MVMKVVAHVFAVAQMDLNWVIPFEISQNSKFFPDDHLQIL